ncbi:MAG: GH1 family beta-glucosidase [Bacteroidia bacterium]|nr:GH1 family beta-glucosidase [Bacteroidia bacterium]
MNRRELIKKTILASVATGLSSGLLARQLRFAPVISRNDFGKDFVWGAATAAYQIEGAWNEEGKGESVWDHFTHNKKNRIKTRENGDAACDFYHRYESDIDLLSSMNIPAFRFSIAWSRILPSGTGAVNQKGIDFYSRLIDKCLKAGVEPWVTLYHWDIPQALEEKGGWENRDVCNWFAEYVELCTKHFGDRVKNWMVFNEPMAFTALGYMLGVHAPGKRGMKGFLKAAHHTVLCHGIGGRIIRKNVPNAHIGTTFSCSPIDAWKEKPANIRAAKREDVLINRLFIEPVLGMGYPIKDLPAIKKIEKYMLPEDAKNMAFDFDFIGVQNYSRLVARDLGIVPLVRAVNVNPKKLGHDVTEMNWEVYPEGIYRILKQFADYSTIKKLIVTENGAAFRDEVAENGVKDPKRQKFLQDYLEQVLKAQKEGVPVKGYFVWSFMDNFEWAEGYRPRFGLVHVDFNTQKRTIKDSGLWFKEFLGK